MATYDHDEPIATTAAALPTIAPPTLPAAAPESRPPAQYNPLDARPADFAMAAQNRIENFDLMRDMLRRTLVKGKDFAKIHVVKNCDNKYNCSNPRHYSGYQLTQSGGDKIYGILGLRVAYPGEEDYRRASLKGIELKSIIMKAMVYSGSSQLVAEGSGAATTAEHSGDLNNTLKKAQKRARMDALQRLPVISALFEDDFFDQLKEGENTLDRRQAAVDKESDKRFNVGAALQEMPYGKHKGTKFVAFTDSQLRWYMENRKEHRDIAEACRLELHRRAMNEPANEAEAFDRELEVLDRKYGTGKNRQKTFI